MLIPKKGDYSSVPLNAEGKKAADTWDPAMLASDGCKAFGASAIMRVPSRLNITWAGDSTLRIDTDAGQQTRLLRFDMSEKPDPERSWQGFSAAEWDRIPAPGGLGVSLQRGPGKPGALKVITTNMRAGYLRRNGVPYSDATMMTEYFDRLSAYGTEWMTVLTHRRRSALPRPALYHLHPFQARAGYVEMEAHALRTQPIRSRS
jgi:hypothetical protein